MKSPAGDYTAIIQVWADNEDRPGLIASRLTTALQNVQLRLIYRCLDIKHTKNAVENMIMRVRGMLVPFQAFSTHVVCRIKTL
jgi:hypothetical protein